ncbi:hypothetical protein QBC37DRAFT_430201 [Rhypophila decipiens]|uniref:Uncharacterized protein n=1 Tax=Rhypophila decipiens TaxID=261697 RepID=A0AAN6XZ15_9PEZI|nr:hypothetical protein QBC37DRAFT_430201 [Rhypophila decipiens]
MRIFLDISAFLTIESIVDARLHHTPLLAFCFSGGWTVEGLSILLNRGANVHARNKFGETCLALCVSRLIVDTYSAAEKLAETRAVLRSLIRRGADVFALDDSELSVSEEAYYNNDEGTSAPGDLWDVVLADCGFDVAWFRMKYGIRRYGYGYTRQMFEDLWKGQEHLCPYYYDDEEAPDTDEDSAEWITTDEELDDTNDDDSSDDSDTEGGAYWKDKGDDI